MRTCRPKQAKNEIDKVGYLKTSTMDLFTLFAIFICWLFGLFFFWRTPRLSEGIQPGKRLPVLSLIIPARNEEKNLARLLRSVGNGVHRPAEIIVVDDHSEDGTGKVGAQGGCTVIRSAELPDGWVGKTWACWQGAGIARGDLFLFLDADTVLESGGLSRLIQTYQEKGGLVSVYPYHRMGRPFEQLSAFFNLISMA
ncbi:MAG TPA: glycosyltransferase family A protein, partial [Thermodesulfobacteriota bacterium]|nr:glycosyltransferase family A protein [Thermodesulfobacteriota bacterium]